jgi:signal transduction histidine kinase
VTATLVPSRFVVEAADQARRRLERDLHDGAQQRFVTASMELGMAMRAAERGDLEALARQLARVRAELDGGLTELRDLARGIYPAVLGDRGLRPAVDALLTHAACLRRWPATCRRAPPQPSRPPCTSPSPRP